MKTPARLLVLLLAPFSGDAQAARFPVAFAGTRLAVYAPHFTDALSCAANAAALAGLDTFSFGVCTERRFLLADLSVSSAAAVVPSRFGTFGVGASFSGTIAYRETSLDISYGRHFGQVLSGGVRFGYGGTSAGSYGRAARVLAEAGILVRLSPRATAGVRISNPGGGWRKGGGGRLAGIYTCGVGYELSERSFLAAEILKQEDEPVTVNAGFHYGFARLLAARIGFISAASQFYLGVGVDLNRLRLDVVATLHPYLGMTPGFGLLYVAKRARP
ncbi:MAG: hypothetical protein JWP27_2430 [Flaviaesturariibacter sp.]|nr:hypothetical protein [Flaviaesturariibacter sp.]